MLQPYDIDILPTVFFQAPVDKQKLVSSTSFFRKRANTTDRIGEQIKNSNHKFNMTMGTIESSLPTQPTKSTKIKANMKLNESCQLTVPKHKYDLLFDQNRLKDEKISTLEGQVQILREKNQELYRLLGIVGSLEGDQFGETGKLNEVTNQMKDRRRIKK